MRDSNYIELINISVYGIRVLPRKIYIMITSSVQTKQRVVKLNFQVFWRNGFSIEKERRVKQWNIICLIVGLLQIVK